MGYTGKGRLVCHFDTGIDGAHPALYSSWKGHDGDSAAAWFGRSGPGGFPTAITDHGTLVTGVMVGHDDSTGDTIGVAPGAQWIGAAEHAWEWAANPDGDANTTDDVPDVINISFDLGSDCWDRYWEEIDMVEALGIVVVAAAGNRGRDGPMSVVCPASRAADSLTNFAVGSIRVPDGAVSAFSGRGPSPCDGTSTKPNIVAPGENIRSASLDSSYVISGGTSLSAPHVAGTVAILRQYSPNASVREIKEALLAGCTPAGDPRPNNSYGWGILNVPASIDHLSGEGSVDLKIKSFEYEPTLVGDTLVGQIVVKNRGSYADSVRAIFTDHGPEIAIVSDSIDFGLLGVGDTAIGSIPLTLAFSHAAYPGQMLPIAFEFRTSLSQVQPCTLTVQAGVSGERSFFTHRNDLLQFTVSNFGEFGFADLSARPLGGAGFRYGDASRNWLYQAGLVVATDSSHVVDGFRDSDGEPDEDFWINCDAGMVTTTHGAVADQETYSVFYDGLAENRIGLRITQRTFSYATPPDKDFVLLEYAIQNITGQAIEQLLVGLCFDWTFQYPNYDHFCEGAYSPHENLGYLYRRASVGDTIQPDGDRLWYRGLAVLNDEGTHSHQVMVQPVGGFTHGSPISEAAKYEALSGGIPDTVVSASLNQTLLQFIATGPYDLSPGESDTAVFAVIGADSLSQMRDAAKRAQAKWREVHATALRPERFTLEQNHPNPFNRSTTVRFTLYEPARVALVVYNILGQTVETVLDRELRSGRWSATWDARSHGSGVYFYRMTVGGHSQSRKMVLIR